MQKRKLALLSLCLACLPSAALANSSWRWFTKTRPHDLLPAAIALTIALEIYLLVRLGGVKRRKWAAGSVIAANLVSFLAPWALEYEEYLYSGWSMYVGFDAFLSKTPHYQVTILFLALTLLFELPVLYLLLRKRVQSKKRLMLTAAGANALTTLICAGMERMLCRGQW